LRGTLGLDIGNDSLGVEAAVAMRVRHDGISGSVSGRVMVPGDYSNFTGSFEAGAWGFNVHISEARFRLGGVVLIEGSLTLELRRGVLGLWLDNVSAQVSNFLDVRLSGSINSTGYMDISGTAYFSVGPHSL